jgi:hypothetical protein
MNKFSRKPIFWILLSFVFIGGISFTVKFFGRSFPIINLDLKMDRGMALKSAKELSTRYHWASEGYQEAASFELDSEVQNFVELEAGGPDAFAEMIKGKLYSPYFWYVRHFKEHEIKETRIRFTPKGEPYGFFEKIPEKDPGAVLEPEVAQQIAEKAAQTDWKINLSEFALVEKSKKVRPGGRVDHTFVYERPTVKIGEGHYRLRLVVSGDRLTELKHFIKVPDAFSRRYEEMRSANNTIAMFAQLAMVGLYLVGGCLVGLFFLFRRRWVVWKMPVFFAAIVALFQVLASVNELPLEWVSYDTADSVKGFILNHLVGYISSFVEEFVLLGLSFMAAESLSRRAFGDHIQQWRLWTSEVANSPSVWGRTLGGYLMVGFDLAFVVGLYFVTSHFLGWWDASEALVDPNILANYFPCVSPLANAFHAGFWEESLFRAVPLASAALIGRKWGRPRLCIGLGMAIQALVFAACHANYPAQPAYARVVELIIPSLIWGTVYLRFGLLPCMICHFTYDAVLMSLPLFVSSAPGIWNQRIIVILCVLIPLWILFVTRLRTKKLAEVPEQYFNRSWSSPQKEVVEDIQADPVIAHTMSPSLTRAIIICGVCGLIALIFISGEKNQAPPLELTVTEARDLAQKVLAENGVHLSSSWKILTYNSGSVDDHDCFVWQKGGEAVYQSLMGSYLFPPVWGIRFARFDGDVAERAEEYTVFFHSKDKPYRVEHILPEDRAGASLDENAAREMAHAALKSKFQMEASDLEEISAEPSKQKARQDWTFTFSDKKKSPLKEGEIRIRIQIAGDQVVNYYRFIYVPEEWRRQEQNRKTIVNAINTGRGLLIVILVLVGVGSSIVSWSRKKYSVPTFWKIFLILFFLSAVSEINSWPSTFAGFSTSKPLMNQISVSIAVGVFKALFSSAFVALIAGFVHNWARPQIEIQKAKAITIALSWSLLHAGLLAAGYLIIKPQTPTWANFQGAANYVPILNWVESIPAYVMMAILALFLFTAIDRFTQGWTKRKGLFSFLLFLGGFILGPLENLREWLLFSPALGIFLILGYCFIFRCHLEIIPLTAAVIVILSFGEEISYHAYPGAVTNAVFGIIAIAGISFYLFNLFGDRNKGSLPPPIPVEQAA